MSVRSSLHACMQVHDRQDHGCGKPASCASLSSQSERSTRHDMFPVCSAWLLAAGPFAGCQGCFEEPCAHDIWHVHRQTCMHEVRLSACMRCIHSTSCLHTRMNTAWDQGRQSMTVSCMHCMHSRAWHGIRVARASVPPKCMHACHEDHASMTHVPQDKPTQGSCEATSTSVPSSSPGSAKAHVPPCMLNTAPTCHIHCMHMRLHACSHHYRHALSCVTSSACTGASMHMCMCIHACLRTRGHSCRPQCIMCSSCIRTRTH